MKTILIPKTQGDTLAAQLISLYGSLKGLNQDEQVEFNLVQISWTCPLLILPISAYINDTDSTFNIDGSHSVKPYLDVIKFPGGVDSVSSFEQQIQAHKTYIPISVLRKQPGPERERLETQFAVLISSKLVQYPGIKDAVYYPISELVTNIFEHSKEQTGYLFGQWYPKKKYLDICIVDTGRGLAASYKEAKGMEFSDAEAIKEVMRGHSTKSDTERGFGVRTSKKVVCEGLGGGFVLLSGGSALISENKQEKLINLPDFSWKGVIIAYRIPEPKGPLKISDYLE